MYLILLYIHQLYKRYRQFISLCVLAFQAMKITRKRFIILVRIRLSCFCTWLILQYIILWLNASKQTCKWREMNMLLRLLHWKSNMIFIRETSASVLKTKSFYFERRIFIFLSVWGSLFTSLHLLNQLGTYFHLFFAICLIPWWGGNKQTALSLTCSQPVLVVCSCLHLSYISGLHPSNWLSVLPWNNIPCCHMNVIKY